MSFRLDQYDDEHRWACLGCGEPVSRDFIRVLGTPEGVHACPDCGDKGRLAQQAAGTARDVGR